MDKEGPNNLACTETASVLQVTSLSFMDYCVQLKWGLDDHLRKSSLLIFVGTIQVEFMLNPCKSMDRTENNTTNRFRIGEKPSLNVPKYPIGLKEKV